MNRIITEYTTGRSIAALAVVFLLVTGSAYSQPADESLTLDQYMEMGISSPDRIWGAADYSEAVEALTSVSKNALPRLGSARSGALFARMISTENLLPPGGVRQVIDSGMEVAGANIQRLVEYSRTVPPLLMLYVDQNPGVQGHSAEVTRVSLFALQTAAASVDLAYAFLATQPKETMNSPRIVSARKQMSDGLDQTLNGLLDMVSQEEHFRSDDVAYLADGLRREVPPIFKYLSAAQKKSMRTKIQKIAAKHKNSRVRESLKGLLAAVKK